MPDNFGTRRTALLSDQQVEDVILNCREPSQDAEFAAKYGVTPACIANYRLGKAGRRIRERLLEEGKRGTEGEW
jgi:hypothetical protein